VDGTDKLLRTLPRSRGTEADTTGRVGVIGGSVDFPGRPTLTALAALRAGSDAAKALVFEESYTSVASHSPNVLAGRYADERFADEAVDRAIELDEWVDALVIGPGLVDADGAALERTVSVVDVPVVVDADAIDPLLESDLSGAVVTPNDNELEHIEDEYGSLAEFATATGVVAVAKSDVDVIVADGERSPNETGTAVLSVVGSGDTMAGVIAAFVVQGLDRAEAAELGAWIVGEAGELAAAERGKRNRRDRRRRSDPRYDSIAVRHADARLDSETQPETLCTR
jgi:hydroxyethylthiazole kinase-like uncharacterized protein yjeF